MSGIGQSASRMSAGSVGLKVGAQAAGSSISGKQSRIVKARLGERIGAKSLDSALKAGIQPARGAGERGEGVGDGRAVAGGKFQVRNVAGLGLVIHPQAPSGDPNHHQGNPKNLGEEGIEDHCRARSQNTTNAPSAIT